MRDQRAAYFRLATNQIISSYSIQDLVIKEDMIWFALNPVPAIAVISITLLLISNVIRRLYNYILL